MTDIKLTLPDFDFNILDGDLEIDRGLETAVIISLFTDRRAEPDDRLPGDDDDRRGWWADTYSEIEGDLIGSRLWLLSREKQTLEVLNRAKEYAAEALQWMIEDGVVQKINVTTEIIRQGILGLNIQIDRPDLGPMNFKYYYEWESMNVFQPSDT